MFNSIPIILNLMTNRNIALIYSVTICEQQQKKGLCTVRELPTSTTAPLFSTLMFAGFHIVSLAPHKRLLTFKQHSFPFVVFAPIRSLTLFSMRPIKSQNIVNNVVFPALSALFSNSQVLEGCHTDTAGNNHIHRQRNLRACM